MADSPFSTCSAGGDAALSWRVPMLVMAGLCSAFTCCFVILFHTEYRRLDAEAQASGKKTTLTTCDSMPNRNKTNSDDPPDSNDLPDSNNKTNSDDPPDSNNKTNSDDPPDSNNKPN